jgi:hypothetical protein
MKLYLLAVMTGMAMIAVPMSAAEPAKPAPVCPANPVLPPELADWARAVPGKTFYAYGEPREADFPTLGAARTELPLHKAESLRYWITPERAPDPFKYGGLVPIEVKKAGRLVVALDTGAWIDLVRDAKFVKSAAHGHGPACSGIRKMVEFDVQPGRYVLQISSAPAASVRAMAVLRN